MLLYFQVISSPKTTPRIAQTEFSSAKLYKLFYKTNFYRVQLLK